MACDAGGAGDTVRRSIRVPAHAGKSRSGVGPVSLGAAWLAHTNACSNNDHTPDTGTDVDANLNTGTNADAYTDLYPI